MIRRESLTLGVDRLLTLTTREDVQSVAVMDARLKRFVRRMREFFPGYKLIGVLERHKQNRNGYHVHIGLPGFHDVNIIRACWRWAVTGDENLPDANIDIAFKPDGKGNQYGKAAAYMCKYLGKDLDGEHMFNAKRYRVSKGIEMVVDRVVLQARNQDDAMREVFKMAKEMLPLSWLLYQWDGGEYGCLMVADDGDTISSKGVFREPEAYP